jgi:hypothetical protein
MRLRRVREPKEMEASAVRSRYQATASEDVKVQTRAVAESNKTDHLSKTRV